MPTDSDSPPPAAAWAELSSSLGAVLEALREVWLDPAFRPEASSALATSRITVQTVKMVDGREITGANSAATAATADWLIRGTEGVTTRVSAEDRFRARPVTVSTLVKQALFQQRNSLFDVAPDEETWGKLRQATGAFVAAIRQVPVLGRRLYDAHGSRVYEPGEIDERLRTDRADAVRFMILMSLDDVMTAAFVECGLDPLVPDAFDRWDELRASIWKRLQAIAQIEHHSYRATAFLNGPLVGSDDAVTIANIEVGDLGPLRGPITLARATDEDLTAVAREWPYPSLPSGVDTANTRLTFEFVLPADGPTEAFRQLYPFAAEVVRWVTDAARLALGRDIGASYLELKATSVAAPSVPKNYAWDYQPDYSIHIPRRMSYLAPDAAPLTDEQVAEVSRLLRARMFLPEVVGLRVALRRFQDSYERYYAHDPERLLDLVIALEAVVMNDQQKDQIAHRLRVRVARLLGTTPEERRAIFASVGTLYTVRSRVAHGSGPPRAGSKEARQLAAAMEDGPSLVRRTIVRMLEGGGPTGLTGDALQAWWVDRELE